MASHNPKLVEVAVLDDYQDAALSAADWTSLSSKIETTVFKETLHDETELVKRLLPFEIICAMRERTKFPSSLLSQLPNLRLIATTGSRNAGIDVKVCALEAWAPNTISTCPY
jgi:phosphoglycerate dehydrogenase-like enzyme